MFRSSAVYTIPVIVIAMVWNIPRFGEPIPICFFQTLSKSSWNLELHDSSHAFGHNRYCSFSGELNTCYEEADNNQNWRRDDNTTDIPEAGKEVDMVARLCPTSLRTDVVYEFGFILVANFIVMVAIPACLLAYFNIRLFQAIKVAETYLGNLPFDLVLYVSEIRRKSWPDQPWGDFPPKERQKASTSSHIPCHPLWRVQHSQVFVILLKIFKTKTKTFVILVGVCSIGSFFILFKILKTIKKN